MWVGLKNLTSQGKSLFFTADEHYGHENIIRLTNRPFDTIQEMHDALIKRSNSVVRKQDTVIHCGDFSFWNRKKTQREIIPRLNGSHLFIKGDHDKWLVAKDQYMMIVRHNIDIIVACHYAMRTWPFKHDGSYQVFGHSHGRAADFLKSTDVGVDCWNYYPVRISEIKKKLGITKSGNLPQKVLESGTIVDEEF